MLKHVLIVSVLLFAVFNTVNAQTENKNKEEDIVLETATGKIRGTIQNPEKPDGKQVIALIISGSGPTDRNGNNPMMTNNSLKMLANELADNGIASVRFDKRSIAASMDAATSENELRFETYINDVKDWVKKLKTDKRYSRIVIIGHSEGSLIGMVAAATTQPAAFISIAGAGEPADKIIREQLASQPQAVKDTCNAMLDKLLAGKTISNVNPMFNALFRPSVQPYLISWFKYDPAKEISKLNMPVLIVQGTTDIQVSQDQARLLANANHKAKLAVIANMNHILKAADEDKQKNIATYNNPDLPIVPEVSKAIVSFIKEIK